MGIRNLFSREATSEEVVEVSKEVLELRASITELEKATAKRIADNNAFAKSGAKTKAKLQRLLRAAEKRQTTAVTNHV